MNKRIRQLILLTSCMVLVDFMPAHNFVYAAEVNTSGVEESTKGNENVGQSLENINEGVATLEDYLSLGISVVTRENLEYVNRELKGKECYSIEDVQVEVLKVVTTRAAIDRINKGVATISDFYSIGINTVNINNLEGINKYLKGSGCYTVNEIQEKVLEYIITSQER